MRIDELFRDPNRKRFAAQAEADVFAEKAALQEAQLQDVHFDVLRSTAYLLFDCRGALQISMGNTAVVVAGGIGLLSWDGRHRGPRTAWSVVGWDPDVKDGKWTVSAAFVPYAHMNLSADWAEVYIGNVPGCDEPQPDYGEATEIEMLEGLAGWRSEFEVVHAMFLAPYDER